ncbi:hypothetical protein [Caloranaerobacter azorensis]|uniref:hypothetical protein n=1 Tax=Caloranaerobacter azorensis TaxID=116090 RepID=UPI000A47DEDD|nr:hypothetical protein [Caloranaerobacter azorensis]
MDSGYDFEYIYGGNTINRFNRIPIIVYNPRGSYAPPEGLDKDFNPICSTEFKPIYCVKNEDYIKFRYPHVLGKCNCLFGMNWCSSSNYIYSKINYKENPRIYVYPLRSSSQWQNQYDKRTSVERCNSRLKGYLNLDNIRSKGVKRLKFMHC